MACALVPSATQLSFSSPVVASVQRQMRPRHLSVRCSNAEGPLRRPATPGPSTEGASPSPLVATAPAPSTSTSTAERPAPAVASLQTGVTIEYQRQRAKEMVAYFQEQKFEQQILDGRVFGWTRKNEIGNGRWTMFGLAVGLLTEFATGVNFPEQLKIIISNLGIADLD